MSRFKRILLKLSGESLMGNQQYGIDPERLGDYARQIKEIHEMGVQIGIVIGGGNIFRGVSGAQKGFDRVKGDQMGMLHQMARHRSNGTGQCLHLLSRHRVALFHHRHRFIAARTGNRSRRNAERHAR